MQFFKYKTYQDVRGNIFWASLVLFNLAGFLALELILPPAHRAAVLSFFEWLAKGPIIAQALEKGSALLVFSILAYALVEVFRVHDAWYDRYVVRWRRRYDIDFILPRLCQPFLAEVRSRFFEIAETQVQAFMRDLFYPYAMDEDSKIGKNLLVRFYERITKYWMTQMNEIVLILMTGMIVAYGASDSALRERLFLPLAAVGGLFALNRLWVRQCREDVRDTTADEIRAILNDHQEDLRSRFLKTCADYGVPF